MGTQLAPRPAIVNIRFTSSLTSEDENALAPVVLRLISSILDLLPIAYSLRIDTIDDQTHMHSRPGIEVGKGPLISREGILPWRAGVQGTGLD
jgi:hypothetical protein